MAEKYSDDTEKGRRSDKGTGFPLLTHGMGTRISEASRLVGGKKKLSELISLSEPQLHRIISGKNQPKAETVAEIAKVTGVSLAWLITGEGAKTPDAADHKEVEYVLHKIEELADGIEDEIELDFAPGDGAIPIPPIDTINEIKLLAHQLAHYAEARPRTPQTRDAFEQPGGLYFHTPNAAPLETVQKVVEAVEHELLKRRDIIKKHGWQLTSYRKSSLIRSAIETYLLLEDKDQLDRFSDLMNKLIDIATNTTTG